MTGIVTMAAELQCAPQLLPQQRLEMCLVLRFDHFQHGCHTLHARLAADDAHIALHLPAAGQAHVHKACAHGIGHTRLRWARSKPAHLPATSRASPGRRHRRRRQHRRRLQHGVPAAALLRVGAVPPVPKTGWMPAAAPACVMTRHAAAPRRRGPGRQWRGVCETAKSDPAGEAHTSASLAWWRMDKSLSCDSAVVLQEGVEFVKTHAAASMHKSKAGNQRTVGAALPRC
jgi:hypothetical protein